MEIVDAHLHIGNLDEVLPDFGASPAAPPFEPEADIRNRVQGMKQNGVAWAVIQPSHGYLRPEGIKDTMRVNDAMADYRRRDPVHFPIALGTVEPTHGERSLEELDRIKHELHLDGVSWHHRLQGCNIANRWMRPILRRMADLQLVPVVHTNAESNLEASWQLQRLALEFPDLTFLALDAFYGYSRSQEVLATAQQTPNILWDMGGSTSWVSADLWVRQNGAETICYSGGGYSSQGGPARPPRMLEELQRSRLSEKDKAKILGLNVRRLFRLTPEGPARPE